MRRLTFILLIIGLLVSGCRGGQETPQTDDGDIDYYNGAITWSNDPSHIIFQADIVSPLIVDEEEPAPLSVPIFPLCTIYGDGRVVWTVQADDPLNSVLVGPVDEQRIRVFVNLLVLEDIYNQMQLGDLQVPIPRNIETLRLNVNDLEHTADLYGGLTDSYYYEVVERCKNISPRPQIYRPDALWLHVQEQPYDPNMPSILWEAQVTGVDLATIADSGQPSWIEGRVVHLLWAYQLRANHQLQYAQGERNFVVTLDIPNVTRPFNPAP